MAMEAADALSFLHHPAATKQHLGTLLVRDGLLTSEQLEAALTAKEATGQRLGEIVVDHGWVSPRDLARALAEQHGLEYLELAQLDIDPAATSLLPEKFARRYQALPVRFEDEDTLLVAVADPTDVVTSDDLRLALGLNVRFGVVAAPDLAGTISRMYRTHVDLQEADEPEPELPQTATVEDLRDGAAPSAPAIKLVNSLVARAIDDRASDVHFEPQAKQMVVRARVDGVMRQLAVVPKSMQAAVTSRLKIMGELDIAERRAPQDGRVSVRFGG